MKDFDLKSKIRSIRVPQREEEYWEAFPQRVMAQTRNARNDQRTTRENFMAGIWWGARLAVTCLMLGFCLWESQVPRTVSHVLRQDEREFRQSIQRIDYNVGRLMQDEHGLEQLVGDQP